MQQDDDSAVEPIHWLVYTDGPQPLLAVREKKGLSLVGRRFEEFRLPEDIKAITVHRSRYPTCQDCFNLTSSTAHANAMQHRSSCHSPTKTIWPLKDEREAGRV